MRIVLTVDRKPIVLSTYKINLKSDAVDAELIINAHTGGAVKRGMRIGRQAMPVDDTSLDEINNKGWEDFLLTFIETAVQFEAS